MKVSRFSRVVLLILLIVAAAFAAVMFCADMLVRRAVQYALDEAVAKSPELQLSYGDVRVSLASRTIEICDIAMDTIDRLGLHDASVGTVVMTWQTDGFTPQSVDVLIDSPSYSAAFDGPSLPTSASAYLGLTDSVWSSLLARWDSTLRPLADKMPKVAMSGLAIRSGHVRLAIEQPGLVYESDSICYRLGGSLHLGATRLGHTCDKWQLSRRMGNVPVVWMSCRMDSVEVIPPSLRAALQASRPSVCVKAYVAQTEVFADMRVAARQPYKMPQEILADLGLEIGIDTLEAHVGTIQAEVALSRQSVGRIRLRDTDLKLRHLSSGSTTPVDLNMTTHIGKGTASCGLSMKRDKACHWSCSVRARRLDLHALDDLLYPLVAIRVGADVQRLTADYKGDKAMASGTFCMEYSDLTVNAYADSPSLYAFTPSGSRLITGLCGLFLPKSNPRKDGKAPRSYMVDWTRDKMLPTTAFFLGPLVEGTKETLLPGFYLHRRIKE